MKKIARKSKTVKRKAVQDGQGEADQAPVACQCNRELWQAWGLLQQLTADELHGIICAVELRLENHIPRSNTGVSSDGRRGNVATNKSTTRKRLSRTEHVLDPRHWEVWALLRRLSPVDVGSFIPVLRKLIDEQHPSESDTDVRRTQHRGA